MTPALALQRITCTFAAREDRSKRYTAVENTTLVVAPGEFVSVVGPTGCGKSTLLNVAAGLLEPSSGSVLLNGVPLRGLNVHAGYLFQTDALMPWRNALGNVIAGLEFRGVPRAEALDRGREWLRRVGLVGFGDRYPHQLSGGMRKRVALAQTLILDPQILLMDEPFSALDEPTRIEMQRLIMDLWHEVESTVMIVTHSIAEAVYLGDRVWVMAAGPGRIVHEFKDAIPKTRESDPLVVQETAAFKNAVREVGEAFRKVEARK